MAVCRVVIQESQGLVLGAALTAPWSMVVVKVVPRPLEDQVWVVLEWHPMTPVPHEWLWQRGQSPTRYRTLAALAASAFLLPAGG
jgi:hypothetical protein